MFWVIFPEQCRKSVLLICCIVWLRPKIFFSGLPSGQLLRNKRTIPVTNIAELVEYVLLPHNNEVTKPRALNTFLDGLAELGIDKGLIKNKKLLSDLIEKEKGYQNVENTSDNESNNEESSSDIENQEEEEVASENGVEAEDTQESDNDTENDSQETESSNPETSTTFHSKSPCEHCENSNVYGHWSWNVLNAFGTITTRFVLYAITRFPRGDITWKRAFFDVTIAEQLHTKTRRRWKPISIPLLQRRTKMKIN